MSKLDQFNALLTELSQGTTHGRREVSAQLAADLATWLGPDALMSQCNKIVTLPPRFAKGRLTRGSRVKGF